MYDSCYYCIVCQRDMGEAICFQQVVTALHNPCLQPRKMQAECGVSILVSGTKYAMTF